MIERIEKYEEIFNKINKLNKKMDNILDEYKDILKDIKDINKYYGSKTWFKDLESFDNKELKVKAGVLSEDGIWNMDEDIVEIAKKMNQISSKMKKNIAK